MTCKNCSAPLDGPFCSNCGQKLITERLTVRRMLGLLFHTITNIDRGFLHTTQQLILAPEKVLSQYVNGATRKYYEPLRFFLIWMGVSVLIGLSFGFYELQGEIMNKSFAITDDPEALARQKKINDAMKGFLNIIPLFLIPFQSLISRLLFKKTGYNYAEHLVFNTYMYGQLAFIGLVPLIFYIIFPAMIPFALPFSMVLATIYYAYVYRRMFKASILGGFFKGLLVNIGGFFLFLLSSLIIGILVGILMALYKNFIAG